MKNKYKEPFDMATVPDSELFSEAKHRYAKRRDELGPYFASRKLQHCKLCNQKHSTRDLRTRVCLRKAVIALLQKNPNQTSEQLVARLRANRTKSKLNIDAYKMPTVAVAHILMGLK